MKKTVQTLFPILILFVIVNLGCDLGTYEQRTAEPMSSKLKANQPNPPAENETESVNQ